jgi:biopolymer transport protein ExbB/TolQ
MSLPLGQIRDTDTVIMVRRSRANLAAFVIGIPLAAVILGLIHFGPLRETTARRYVTHPVECIGVLMFCMAAGALGTKLRASWTERRACRLALVPPWDGKTIPVEKAGELLARLKQLPARIQNTFMVQRIAAVLDFLCQRGSADELDDQLRNLADTDALALESSYALTRFITWAIPIIGFLGTVLGITGAISGVTPEVLEKSLSTVTDGLALAFDTTALALGLTMLTMFLSFIVERAEQGVLDQVDRSVERALGHRFERTGRQDGEFAGAMRKNTEAILQTVEHLVQRQTVLWAQALEKVEKRSLEVEQAQESRLTATLDGALERTLDAHAHRLSGLEQQFSVHSSEILRQLATMAATVREADREQHAAAGQIIQSLAGQLQALRELQEGDKHLRRLQETLSQNLATLAGAGAFEQAVHSLTAAVHLLTARAAPPGAGARIGPRPGAAA